MKDNRLCYIDWLTSTGTIKTVHKFLESLQERNVLIATKKVNSITKYYMDIKNDNVNLTYVPLNILKLDTFQPIIKEFDVVIIFNFIYDLETANVSEMKKIVGSLKDDSKLIIFAHDDDNFVKNISEIEGFHVSIVQNMDQLDYLDMMYYRYKRADKLSKFNKKIKKFLQ